VTKLQGNERLRSLNMAYVDDGILDIFVGWIIFFAGLMLLAEMFWMAGVYVAIFIPVLWSAKEQIILPRLAKEDLRPVVTQKSFNATTSVILCLVLMAVLGGLTMVFLFSGRSGSTWMGLGMIIGAAVMGGSLIAGFVAAARSYRAPRWYAYGPLVVLFGLLAFVTGISLPWWLMALGAIISSVGAFHLARFLRSHSLLPQSERALF
jgi:hypothetical protein